MECRNIGGKARSTIYLQNRKGRRRKRHFSWAGGSKSYDESGRNLQDALPPLSRTGLLFRGIWPTGVTPVTGGLSCLFSTHSAVTPRVSQPDCCKLASQFSLPSACLLSLKSTC